MVPICLHLFRWRFTYSWGPMKIMTWGPAKFVIHWFPGPVESFKLSSPALLHTVTGRSVSLPCTPGTVRLLALAVQWRKRVPQYMLNVTKSLHVFLLLWWLIVGLLLFLSLLSFSHLLLRVGVSLLLGFSLSYCGWVGCFLSLLGFSLLLWMGVLPLLSFFLSFYCGWVLCRCCVYFSPSILDGCFVVVVVVFSLLLWIGVLSLLGFSLQQFQQQQLCTSNRQFTQIQIKKHTLPLKMYLLTTTKVSPWTHSYRRASPMVFGKSLRQSCQSCPPRLVGRSSAECCSPLSPSLLPSPHPLL